MSRNQKQPNGLPVDYFRKAAKSGTSSRKYVESLASRLIVGAPEFDFQGYVTRQVLAALEDEQNNVSVELMPTRRGEVYVFVGGKNWPLPPDGHPGLMIHKELKLKDMVSESLRSTFGRDVQRTALLEELERCVDLVKQAMADEAAEPAD